MTKRPHDESGLGRSSSAKGKPFGDTAREFQENGYAPIPLNGKQPLVTQWQSYSASNSRPSDSTLRSWIRNFSGANIGLVLGGLIDDAHRLAVIDIDDERFVGMLTAILGDDLVVKKGKKGASAFVRAHAELKTSRLTSPTLGHVVDFLSNKSQTVVPPSIHPETKQPYTWVGRSLLDVDRDDLPEFSLRNFNLMKTIIESEHTAAILEGDTTHWPVLQLSGQCVRHGDDEEIVAAISSLFPAGYDGDSLKELPGMVADAREKGWDNPSDSSDYDPGDAGPRPLGYTEQHTYIFYLPTRRQVIQLSPQQLTTPAGLLGLEEQEFWAERYPKFDKNGNPTGGFTSLIAGNSLMKACRRAGPFNMARVRGRGVWREGDRIIVNLTGDVPEDAKNVYVSFDPVELDGTVSGINTSGILDALSLPNWRNPGDPLLLLGWMFLAPICGVLDWRPHIFIVGARNTGKTTLVNGITKLLSPLAVSLDGQSTEAGIRQTVGPDSLPIILDEFESDGKTSRLLSVLKLARSASSAEGYVARGTPEGRALQFSIRSAFLFAAINPTIVGAADATRIIQLHLDRHDDNPEVARAFNQAMQEFEQYAPGWIKGAISFAPQVPKAVSTFIGEMPPGDSRHNKNIATLLAGAFLALEGRTPNPLDAAAWCEKYFDLIESHAEPHKDDDAEDCLNLLLAAMNEGDSFGTILATAAQQGSGHNALPAVDALRNHGIKWVGDGFVVANKHPGLEAIFAKTRWEGNGWSASLLRIEGAVRREPERFNGPRHRGVFIPASVLDGIEPMPRGQY